MTPPNKDPKGMMSLLRKFLHNVLGWASPNWEAPVFWDGANPQRVCKYCQKNILEDSNGDWFHAE